MESGHQNIAKNPKETANPLSLLTFWWMKNLFKKGIKKKLEISDIYAPVSSDESEKVGDLLEREWNRELEKMKNLEYTLEKDGHKRLKNTSRPYFYKAILRAFGFKLFIVGVFTLFQTIVLKTLIPILQGWIISYFRPNTNAEIITRKDALIYTTYLVIVCAASALFWHHIMLKCQEIGMQIRTACSSLMYRKILRLDKVALTQTASGQIINLLSNDMSLFDRLPVFINFIWIMPIQVVVVGYIMWQQIGFTTIIGIGSLLIFTFPLHGICIALSQKLRAIVAKVTDKRVQFMSELVSGIQVIKIYAWEESFNKIVSTMRAVEISKITLASFVRATYLAIIVFTERTILFITLISYVFFGYELTSETSFVLATYFNSLQQVVALFFPQALITCAETVVSIKRIEKFLLLDEASSSENQIEVSSEEKQKKNKKERYNNTSKTVVTRKCDKPPCIEFTRVSANWILKTLPPTLCSVTMKIEPGQLCTLIGPVGSGKSSLLHVLLKELPLGAGTVTILQNPQNESIRNKRGYIVDNPDFRISFACQEPWLFVGTIRDNILFGQAYDAKRYAQVTEVCALSRDFQLLPQGDMSFIGERGATLSGGQRARINLARAVYREADIYLLDDPLSAVDSRVARKLFNQCIVEYLHGKTRILATHQLQFLKQADTIVCLDHGVVKAQGPYVKLVKSNQDFLDMINKQKNDQEESKKEGDTEAKDRDTFEDKEDFIVDNENVEYEANGNEQEAELLEYTRISHTLGKYFRNGGSICVLSLLIISFVLSQIATSGNDYWVSYWTNVETARQLEKKNVIGKEYKYLYNNTFLASIFNLESNGLLDSYSAIYVYAFCIVSCIVLVVFRSFLFMQVCMKASRKIHNSMFFNLLNTNMKFFHRNPSGRILNRFSKDIGVVDEILPKIMLEALQIIIVIVGILFVELFINPWTLIPLFFLSVVFYYVQRIYMKTVISIKNLESVSKSPVFSHVMATLNGLSTIRSTEKNILVLLRKEFDSLQDVHSGAWYLTLVAAAVVGVILDMLSCCFVAFICFFFLLIDDDNVLGGDVGLAISQSLIIMGTLQYGLKLTFDTINHMTSVGRVLEYTKLPEEKSMTSTTSVPSNWPSKGELVLKNVNMKYEKDGPYVLKNLNVSLEAGWKVGVVGRTGAGKSSLISVFFRLFTDYLEGEIIIDGRDTSTLGLRDLRSRISIIPQEPILFAASLRYNLDPFNQYDDEALWNVLKEIDLTDFALDQMITQDGNNLSVGQRQLICLGRAILRNNRILVLDEATANIDSNTDALIQYTLRTKFDDCTVITIAHRLNTIIDCDRVMVMDAGEIAEFDSPYVLLRCKPNSLFAQMVKNTGETMSKMLYEQAEIGHQRNAKRNIDIRDQNSIESELITLLNKKIQSLHN